MALLLRLLQVALLPCLMQECAAVAAQELFEQIVRQRDMFKKLLQDASAGAPPEPGAAVPRLMPPPDAHLPDANGSNNVSPSRPQCRMRRVSCVRPADVIWSPEAEHAALPRRRTSRSGRMLPELAMPRRRMGRTTRRCMPTWRRRLSGCAATARSTRRCWRRTQARPRRPRARRAARRRARATRPSTSASAAGACRSSCATRTARPSRSRRATPSTKCGAGSCPCVHACPLLQRAVLHAATEPHQVPGAMPAIAHACMHAWPPLSMPPCMLLLSHTKYQVRAKLLHACPLQGASSALPALLRWRCPPTSA